MKTSAAILLMLAIASAAAATAAPAQEKWRVIARGTDSGDRIAVAAAAKRRTTKLAVRVRVTGQPQTATLHTVVTCSKVGPVGALVYSRRDEVAVTAPVMRVLRLPVAYPENCGVTAIGISNSVARVGSITVEILAPCTVQADGRCL